ncbi:AAA family ATPase [Cyanobium sp. HWJ4-Hawea]|uniref:AAA family ATPase n=1 Tax=Cyanobium sp. HWJ4-Hawea TaxID=2823713 RepID=UPI0020CCC451|nr:AAA family ATPase [Cyanobium sp. HWJ4-Hawea]MCP9808793.1 AAA family ATPase [Cyanobium sp. HWJ4-Hawea]
MRLIEACLRNVRQHKQLQLSFDRHFTLVGGPNEAGKSTVVEALHKGLFLKANATGRGVEELRSRLHGGLPEVDISFEAQGQIWQLRKRFAGATGTCQLSTASGTASGVALSGPAAEERLASLLGVDGAIEGRRIAQLPQRWAHLWVRQGEAGQNLLDGPGNGYDLDRLVQQLQQQGSTQALESGIDRWVGDHIQQQLEQRLTATGKVKAGSDLALAQDQLNSAQLQFSQAQGLQEQLEGAMEELRRIGLRLDQIGNQERPALEQLRQSQRQQEQARQKLEAALNLQKAKTEPLHQELRSIEQVLSEMAGLEQQLNLQAKQQLELQQQLAKSQLELQNQQAQLSPLREQQQRLQTEQQLNQGLQEWGQQQLDLEQLEQEAKQLQQHKDQFGLLQQQAETVKAELTTLPSIDADDVKKLRQKEQQLAQAQARCQAMATAIELLAADLPVELEGQPLAVGSSYQISSAQELLVGEGVRLRISPGGGEATAQAEQQLAKCQGQLQELLQQLAVAGSETAEPLALKRHDLTAQLQRLRLAASAIPWNRLDAQLAELQPRRQRLLAALELHREVPRQLEAGGLLPSGRDALQSWLEAQRDGARLLANQLGQLEHQLKRGQGQWEECLNGQRQLESRLEQLAGSLETLQQRRLHGQQSHGTGEQLQQRRQEKVAELAAQQAELGAKQAELNSLEQQLLGQANNQTAGLEQRSQQLEAEKDFLLTARGQQEQRCLSLSAKDPAAEVEYWQASLERANAEMDRLQLHTKALQRLQGLFHQERSALAEQYSAPLKQAMDRYLEKLGGNPRATSLGFDPKAGFGELQLRQGQQGFAFEQLSGGMREQLAAALRLAMAEVLQPAYDNCLPLVFDDAFTNSDPERLLGLGRMVELGIAAGIQIILLSCNPEDYRSLAKARGSIQIMASQVP